MIQFSELMQKYYTEKKLGIRNEDAPTTDTGSLTDYVPPMKTKKKKDMTYDGRTRNVKELVRRIMTRREKRNARRS
tara:strand:- start:631 stop:858 length:228 start_codon:yes stop_codon:yes gene_type:complete